MNADKRAKVITAIIVITAIAFLVAYTFLMYQYNNYNKCLYTPKIWCSDNWKCQNNTSQFNTCYNYATSDTGLASCLFGPNSVQATACKDTVCACPDSYDSTSNCYSGCPATLYDVSGSTACCCIEGSECTPCS